MPNPDPAPVRPTRRLVIVVRADPVICGHSGEARNLAEAALLAGFDDVRIVTWPLEAIQQLPRKPLHSVLPYSPGIVVERPAPVGDYKVPDGRFTAGMVGRLVELFCEDVPTVCVSLYLTPHASVVMEALSVCRALGRDPDVTTIAEAVGSDITNVVRSCVEEGRFGAAAHVFASYLGHDRCVAVSEYTRGCIIDAAEQVDATWGTSFAATCRERVGISYPAIDAGSGEPDEAAVGATLALRGLERDGYVLFLSRLSPEKGVDDLIEGYARSAAHSELRLVIAGTGPALDEMRARAAATAVGGRITFLDDVDDAEKWSLMAGCAAFVLPSKPKPEFVETFGISLVEKMLAGGGPVITTATGGIPEAVGDTAIVIPVSDPDAIAAGLDEVVALDDAERRARADKARSHAMQFDRTRVFERLLAGL
ncbi:glycosyltransferase [Dermatobacter hominis]|uniref:glycosyltransferase n=1 Tax=Dermatobacter hominis TaxID=2884263 RepID=UPI001D12896A|nr:glycosyltransferase [Dermatobacter hominis]UDY35641.1 glycosyltransferase [Dermatobacter hominis]